MPARAGEPRALDDEELFVIQGSPCAQLRDNPEEREKRRLNHRETLFPRPKPPTRRISTGTVRTLSKYCNCGASTVCCTRTHPASVIAHQRACQQPCPRTERTASTTCTTGTSTTLSTCCNCVHLLLHNNGHVNNLQDPHLERGNGHCGYLSLRHNWNVNHFDDELERPQARVAVLHHRVLVLCLDQSRQVLRSLQTIA